MKFLWIEPLLLLALLPLLVALYLYILRRHKRGAVRFASLALVRQALPGSARWRR
jgi:Ca-activated chloride channel family protein